MKIIVLGAYGKSGRSIIPEAEKRGHEVLAVAHRKHEDVHYKNVLIKDIMDLTKEDIAGYDAIIDGVSAWVPETFHVHTDGVSHIANLLEGSNTRYIKIGGTGTLFINKEHTKYFKDWENYMEEYKPLAEVLVQSLERLRSYSNIAWTYATPAFNYDVEGEATGKYHFDGEEFSIEDIPTSHISYADFASALIDILENGSYVRQRMTIVGDE
ncbi:hypothetical protein AN964_04015 [Heyndrickxia shackletonii]|uniref:NAD(P)-binding domain-containing protein n=1 Tax=Heyndrickxia shackletonii TaxID=157838 RepID=A0A0Q3WV62_9BACI|nr:NAD(P)H-binding protein [Heyndrickxia shackletonii]KQL52765.1 hypothetical protein AN964_04015 [Heyndrickxia shackletonii]NEZ00102.1 NAD(P)H-binding protein [Heyndrickxia shackletonii]